MPKIVEYDAPQLGLQPDERGVAATERVARRIDSSFNQAANAITDTGRRIGSAVESVGNVALKAAEHQEISQGSAAFATFMQNKTQQWNDASKNADVNDTTLGRRFIDENLNPDLEKLSTGFITEAGQKWAEQHAEAFRNHMVQKTTADMAQRAGDAVAVNLKQTTNALSNTVNSDPTSLEFALKTVESSMEGLISSSPNLNGEQASRVRSTVLQSAKEQIVKSAAFGYIERTGNVPSWARDPQYSPYINGVELKQFEAYAKAQQRANLLTEKQLQQYQKQQEADAAHKDLSKNFTDSVTFDENGKATIAPSFYKNIMEIEKQHPGAATERAKAMINWGEQQQRERKEIIQTDPDTHVKLYDHLFDTNNPTSETDILRAAAERKLDDHDTRVLLQLNRALTEEPLKGPIWQGTMQAAKDALIVSVPGLSGKDNVGISNYASFEQAFIPEYLKQKRAGTLPPNALDLKDPNSMISKAIAPFKRTQTERMRDFIAGAGGVNLTGPDKTITGIDVQNTPVVKTKDDYDRLPPRSTYVGKDGKMYRKP